MSIPGSLSQAVSADRAPYVFRLQQAVAETVAAPLRRVGGDTPSLAAGYTATLAMATHRGGSDRVDLDSTSLSVDDGTATFSFTTTHTAEPSLMVGRIAIKNSSGTTLERVPCFVEVEPDILSTNDNYPVTLDSLRSRLMDRAAGDNRVLDDYEFEDGEIAAALMTTVDHWNEVANPGLPMYTATTFPYREKLKDGAMGRLYLDKANGLQRNRLPALGEGMQVDDVEHRVKLYLEAGSQLWRQWQEFVTAKIKQERYADWIGDTRSVYF